MWWELSGILLKNPGLSNAKLGSLGDWSMHFMTQVWGFEGQKFLSHPPFFIHTRRTRIILPRHTEKARDSSPVKVKQNATR